MERLFIDEFISSSHKEVANRIFKQAMEGEEPDSVELNLNTKEGRIATVLFNTSARRDLHGAVSGVIGIGQDITELREKEAALEQARKMEMLGQLTGGIAHDFNNLLSIVKGNLRFLQEDIGKSNSDINELFEDAMSAVDDATELTLYLLGFSREDIPGNEEERIAGGAEVILVVEDEPRVRRVALRDLKRLGYSILEAENADVARTIIESGEPIDLLFSDILMPGEMDGHMLGIWTEENYPRIRVVLTSGYSKGKAAVNKDRAKPFPMIRKPYSFRRLAEHIRTELDKLEP